MQHKLTTKRVEGEKKAGLLNDGGGLYLRTGKNGSKSWVYRWRDRHTKGLRAMGLGSFPHVGLAEARKKAQDARDQVNEGADPIVKRKAERIAVVVTPTPGAMTFDRCAEQYIKSKVEPESRNPKHVQQWRNTLKQYASPVFGGLPVEDIDDHHILAVLEPIWYEKTETAQRLMQRIAKILDWARIRKLRTGDNPARWSGYLEAVLPSPAKIKKVQHFKSLPYSELPAFLVELADREGHAARCLELTILTATRTSEARGARWDEIDVDAKLWTIPADRMKMNKPHRVPLSDRALEIIEGQRGLDAEYLFPGERRAPYLSNMAMATVLRRMDRTSITVHGFRSTFRNWAAEQTHYAREVCEAALAHATRNAVEAAYLHSDFLEKRRELMDAWADFCCSEGAGQ